MTIDFSKIRPTANSTSPVNPIEIFNSCRVLDDNINGLWLAQGDALRAYDEHRNKEDVSIVLNTGAGKTLVGLLIAQSLLNESSRQVVYACSSIQLIEQTREKALGYGLDVTTYHGTAFSDDGYEKGRKVCLTTYHALFNGRTRFKNDDIAAVIFDDAHTADQILRDQFTLTIGRDEMPDVYNDLSSLFVEYHEQIGREASYAELREGASDKLLWILPNIVYESRRMISQILREAKLWQRTSTKFAWEHLKDHVPLCCVLFSGSSVTLTPPFIPINTLPYFSNRVRRVYLSATLHAPDSFARTFGRTPSYTVSPETMAGECERMILMPSMSPAIGRQLERETAHAFLREHKALILVPSYTRAESWTEVASLPPKNLAADRVQEFRDSKSDDKEKLLLVGRYDGIDLPGDTCRVLVIDDLPTGSGQLERYLWEYVGVKNYLGSTVASRLVQSFGRISRRLSDFGVIILTGERLVKWLGNDRNLDLLPDFLREQIKLGLQVSEKMGTELVETASACLGRHASWIDTHAEFVEGVGGGPGKKSSSTGEAMVKVALAENEYIRCLWDFDFEGAAKAIGDTLRTTMEVSSQTGAWHMVWRGYALERDGNQAGADELYREAHATERNIPRHKRPTAGHRGNSVATQVRSILNQILRRDGKISLPRNLHSNLAALAGGSSGEVEEALRYLGLYLGFESSRPDKESGVGPDVLWVVDDYDIALCMEAKTDKQPTSGYNKRDIGQLHNHIEWTRGEKEGVEIIPTFVGPVSPSTAKASASEDMLIIEIQSLKKLADRLVSTLSHMTERALPITLEDEVERGMKGAGLLWPQVFESLPRVRIKELAQ